MIGLKFACEYVGFQSRCLTLSVEKILCINTNRSENGRIPFRQIPHLSEHDLTFDRHDVDAFAGVTI
jgi:hypothetical protein